jgi:hypothetical protein
MSEGLSFEKQDTIEIATTLNGYALKTYIYEDDAKDGSKIFNSNIELFENNSEVLEDNSPENNQALINLLYKVAEALGYNYDKYKANNLDINFNKKGDHYGD